MVAFVAVKDVSYCAVIEKKVYFILLCKTPAIVYIKTYKFGNAVLVEPFQMEIIKCIINEEGVI